MVAGAGKKYMELDKDVVNLAKAIRQVETGNRPVSGSSGELASRYQYMPATWQSTAQKYLGDAKAPLTLENENKATYLKIKDWKDSGLGPDQIASMWNSGKPDWQGVVGVNKMGVKYDVPKYVSKVGAEYQKLKSTSMPAAAPLPQQTKGVQGFAGVGVGAVKGAVSTFTGASGLGERLLRGSLKTILPKSLESSFGVSEKLKQTAAEQVIPERLRTPEGTAENIGFAGEQIAEFFIPGAAPLRAGKIAAGAVKGGKLVKGLTRLGVTSAGEGALGLGQSTLQQGGINQESLTSGAFGLATPPALKVAGKITSSLTKGFGKLASESLGISTGAGGKAFQEAFSDSRVVKFARLAGKDMATFQDDLLSDTKAALKDVVERRSAAYVKQLKKIKTDKSLDDVITNARKVVTDSMKKFDITPSSKIDETGKKLNYLDFKNSVLVEGNNVVEKALNDVLGWTDNSAVGLDTLKRRLQRYANQLTAPGKKEAKNIVEVIKHNIKKGLEDNVDGYKKMTQGYQKASEFIDEIERSFSIGNKKSKETAIKKITKSLKEDNDTRKELLRTLGNMTGQDDFTARVAGVQLGQLTPRGFGSKIVQGGAGVLALTNPASWPALLAWSALASPRAVAEVVNILGRVNDTMIKSGKYSPEIQRALREIFIKYSNQSNFGKNE